VVLYSGYYPPSDPTTDYIDPTLWLLGEIERRTEGRVIFNQHWGGDLTKPGEEDDQIKSRLIDMTTIASIFSPGTMPLWEMDGALPFRPADDELVSRVKWQLFLEFPELRAEIEQLGGHVICVASYGSYQIIANRPLETVEDYDGLKVAVVGRFMPRWYSSVGGVPITMPIPDRYGALERGIIDASSLTPAAHYKYGYFEHAKHHGMPDFGAYAAIATVITTDKWNEISPEDQAIIMKVGEERMWEYGPAYYKQANVEFTEKLEAEGVTFYYYTDEQRSQWANTIPNFAQEWIDEAMDAADRDVRMRMWKRYLELTVELGYTWPMDWSDVS